MPPQIIDNHGRILDYLRLSVTDRCNLRCTYCMPQESMKFLPRKELLTYEEMLRLVVIFSAMGLKKLRITGGEPFVRKDLMSFIRAVVQLNKPEIHITTNGVLTGKYVNDLKELNIAGINLSLDTLSPKKFHQLTLRNEFHTVMETFHHILSAGIPLKINVVVLPGVNDDEIIPLARMTQEYPIEVRFIEAMPFDGKNKTNTFIDHLSISKILSTALPLEKKDFISTAQRYQVKNWPGTIGIIPAFTRTFCGTCNRIRVNATGKLKTCLYGKDELDLKELLSYADDAEIAGILQQVFQHRKKNGFEAEQDNQFSHQSMATIGG